MTTTLTMTFSLMFIFLTHPLSMGLILLIQTILIALMTGLMNINYWFSYILFLIMIGGMLVLFMYMTSIASNEKFKFSNILMMMMIFSLLISMILYFTMDNYLYTMMTFSDQFNHNYNFKFNLSKFFNYPSNIILFLMIIYLFITLVAVVKLTNINFGPLRQKF
uniref:NADH-ubiquinone oxidoreductase chain 6 n=1 Tax=Gabronthus thermarum TaxID=878093 RepID=A0A0S2M7K0_9COLE|nr:NADH dehydrogenase subunit 6 [Gabronthus thermarum]ALO70584.1 NADH deshydrogenase subunit 6 [Gabronthus thermarum]